MSNSGLPSNEVSGAVVDTNNNVWFATSNGLCMFDGTTWTVFNTANSGILEDRIYDILVDSSNNIWLATQATAGLLKFDGTNWSNFNTSNSDIGSNFINDLELDQNGHLWIGTLDNGITKFDGTNWTVYNSSNAAIPDDNVLSLGIDNQNNVWIGTYFGASLFDGSSWTLFNVTNSGIPHNTILDFEFDDFGNVWMGTAGGGIGVYNADGVSLNVNEIGTLADNAIFKLFPNPFDTDFHIEIDHLSIGASLLLYDAIGSLIERIELKSVKTHVSTIDYTPGFYYYTIVKENKLLNAGKIIKH